MINDLNKALELSVSNSHTVYESMAYSLLSGGKRVRPMILLSLLKDLGGDYKEGLHAAVALEMIHTYSLVHDDLPAMDNDDYRRHRLTNHKVYGEGMAILAGDGLLTQSFAELVKGKRNLSESVEVLSRNAGPLGMILGQELDIKDEFKDLNELRECYSLKTGCLFAAALELAVLAADRKELQSEVRELGYLIGIAFQYQDDILEATQSFETLGKSVESDTDRNKNTIVAFVGIDEAKRIAEELFRDIRHRIHDLVGLNSECEGILDSILVRSF